MSGPVAVGYLSHQDQDWAQALRKAATLGKLRELCTAWAAWVPDAKAVADHMSVSDFKEFRAGLLAQTRDIGWAARFGAVALPQRLLEVSMVALHFRAPFGTAAIRMAELEPKKYPWLVE